MSRCHVPLLKMIKSPLIGGNDKGYYGNMGFWINIEQFVIFHFSEKYATSFPFTLL